MDTFDPNYDVEMKEIIFLEYNKNKFIDQQSVYVLKNDYKLNMIWSIYFNTIWIIIKNNNIGMHDARDMM